MRRDITLGQYYPVDSLVHRMDPRAKILITLAYIVLVFFVSNYWGYLLLLCAIVGVCLLARLPVRLLLRSLKPLRFILIFTFILNLFFQKVETSSSAISSYAFFISRRWFNTVFILFPEVYWFVQ